MMLMHVLNEVRERAIMLFQKKLNLFSDMMDTVKYLHALTTFLLRAVL